MKNLVLSFQLKPLKANGKKNITFYGKLKNIQDLAQNAVRQETKIRSIGILLIDLTRVQEQ